MSGNISIADVFKRLDEWKEFPWYQHERRADLFFAVFLPDIMELDCLKEDNRYCRIIPEFPLLIKERKSKSKEDAVIKEHIIFVDYAIFKENTLCLVELKTSMKSIKPAQRDDLMEISKENNPERLIRFVKNLCWDKKGKIKNRYSELQKRLEDIATPAPKCLEVMYIQPFEKYKGDVIKEISFEKIKTAVKGKGCLAEAFHTALGEWQKSEAKKFKTDTAQLLTGAKTV